VHETNISNNLFASVLRKCEFYWYFGLDTGATQMIAYTVLSNISFLLYVHMGLQCILL
jgi:hypothetical protein